LFNLYWTCTALLPWDKSGPAGTAQSQFFFRSNVINQHLKSGHQPHSQGAYNHC